VETVGSAKQAHSVAREADALLIALEYVNAFPEVQRSESASRLDATAPATPHLNRYPPPLSPSVHPSHTAYRGGNANRASERFIVGVSAARLRAMKLITILNRCHRFRGFVYQHAHKLPCDHARVRPQSAHATICRRPVMTNSSLRRCGCRRSSLGRRQTHTDQSLHALPSPLGEATVMERDGGGLSHLLGQGHRRGRSCRHLGLEHRTLGQIDAIGVDKIQYSKRFRQTGVLIGTIRSLRPRVAARAPMSSASWPATKAS